MQDHSSKLTPMMRQYFLLKEQAGDAILFFRMGDFYEVFDEDAILVAPRLDIVLTSREKGDQSKVPFCGVPHHAAKSYWLKLLRMGFKVAIGDQVEDPKDAKGIVRREITRFLTPGCIDEIEALDSEQPNYLLALLEDPSSSRWAVCLTDVSTGELRFGEFSEEDALKLVARFQPRELLIRRFHKEDFERRFFSLIEEKALSLSFLSESVLRDKSQQESLLKNSFGDTFQNCWPFAQQKPAHLVVSGLFDYLIQLKQSVSHFKNILPIQDTTQMKLDEIACRDLELFETLRRRQLEGSLFREINCCQSPMGARLLRSFILSPLNSRDQIKQRHDCVSYLTSNPHFLEKIRNHFLSLADLDRLLTRIIGSRILPSELGLFAKSLAQLEALRSTLPEIKSMPTLLAKTLLSLKKDLPAHTLLKNALKDSPLPLGSGSGVFRSGFDAKLDEFNALVNNGSSAVEQYESDLRRQTQIQSLKVRDHKSLGLLIEVTKANLTKIPPNFIRRQTMVNNERFVTEELNELSNKLSSASALAIERESQLFSQLLLNLAEDIDAFREIIQAVALLDVFQSFAIKAVHQDFVRPEISNSGRVNIIGSRHPVVEKFVGTDQFQSNVISMSPAEKHLLITGPNMGGKSTLMRQLAISVILNQIGAFIPANAAELPIFDAVYTRVGASDDLAKGASTFFVEMYETANIVRNASPNSLVILDEVGRGTSTVDGLAIASAVLEELVDHCQCYSLFATHYHELIETASRLAGIKLVQTEVVHSTQGIRFSHKLIPGACNNSYGIEVAKRAGLPMQLIKRAEDHLKKERNTPQDLAQKIGNNGLFPQDFSQNQLKKVSERLKKLKIQRTTPLQALNILNDLKIIIDNDEANVELFPQSP